VIEEGRRHAVTDALIPGVRLLPPGAIGIDAGMTLVKVARATGDGVAFEARETRRVLDDGQEMFARQPGSVAGLTGAHARLLRGMEDSTHVQEIEAGARGASALLESDGRLGDGAFLLVLLGTGTTFAEVRGAVVQHLGGTPLGGGSFAGIARRLEPSLTYEQIVAGAERGDRRKVDVMISDVYPRGIGSVGPDLTAAHLVRADAGSIDDVLAGLLNLHGENIAQIAAGRAQAMKMRRVVLAGGFAHNNPLLVASLTSMAALFGMAVEAVPCPGYAGAVGAALVAASATRQGDAS